MTLSKRLNDFERRLKALEDRMGLQEQFAETVQQAIAEEDAADEGKPQLTLDGEAMGGERDQAQSLG